MTNIEPGTSDRRQSILSAAIHVFGRFGYKKASVDDLAAAAQISKPGLYLHFSGKQEIFLAAFQKYLDDGLVEVGGALARPGAPLFDRLLAAMDVWFGRNFATFAPESFDVIATGGRLAGDLIDGYKAAFRARLADALSASPEFARAGNVCTPAEVAQVLFLCGLTWKEGHASRADFLTQMGTCIRACCQIAG
jgi:AcrR family transcriptional regulator